MGHVNPFQVRLGQGQGPLLALELGVAFAVAGPGVRQPEGNHAFLPGIVDGEDRSVRGAITHQAGDHPNVGGGFGRGNPQGAVLPQQLGKTLYSVALGRFRP